MGLESAVRGSLLLFLLSACSCRASAPLLAWSNTNLLVDVKADHLLETYDTVHRLSEDLLDTDFVVVFAAQRLDFDDIARYGGLYDDASNSPLASIKVAMESATSSVWGETSDGDDLLNQLSLFLFVSPKYLTSASDIMRSSSVQLLVIELYDDSDNQKTSLTKHGRVVGEVMAKMDELGAKYTAVYTTTTAAASHHHSRERRSPPQVPSNVLSLLSPNNGSTNETKQVCNRTAIIYDYETNLLNTTCALLCIQSAERSYMNMTSNTTAFEPLLGVYWPSWREQLNSNGTGGGYHCNLTDLVFDNPTMSCRNSSLQEEYFTDRNLTSNSITAYMDGQCSDPDEPENATEIVLKIEFIFFDGGSDQSKFQGDFVKLPGNQVLMPGYWTMQLFVTDVTKNESSDNSHYLTRYLTDFSNKNSSKDGDALVLKKGLFYPFSIPFYTSYYCHTSQSHLWLNHGNPNRFVPSKIPLNSTHGYIAENVTDGPVLQFVGFQVQSFGNIYGAKPNSTLLEFSSVYNCEGYFDVSSWMGTVVTVILIIMLYFATLALFSTQTVDRFDDPRGRTISVENLH